MKKPLLIVSENEVIAAADAALDVLKKEAGEIADKLGKEFKENARKQWTIIENVLLEKGMIEANYQEDETKLLTIENGVVYMEEKKETKRLLEKMMNEKIKELMND
jgi:hypothetical protein